MYNDRDIVQLDPCPVCAKPKGAYMGSSRWGHDILCCSDTCGLKMNEKLSEMRCSSEYIVAMNVLVKAQATLEAIKAKVIGSSQSSVTSFPARKQ